MRIKQRRFKNKITSKRRFKKLLERMIQQSAFKINSTDFHFYAASNFYCSIKTYKGYTVNFIPVGYMGFPPNYIYLTQKLNVQKNYCN